jgi:uncharacterized protein (DUF4415 family)
VHILRALRRRHEGQYDFSQGRRGAAIPSPGKTRITIRIDDDVLRQYVLSQHEPLEDTLRRVLREEMAPYIVRSDDNT